MLLSNIHRFQQSLSDVSHDTFFKDNGKYEHDAFRQFLGHITTAVSKNIIY